ncbi:type II secretion system F family protein [Sphingomonas sp. 7/4-4]|uniref:type II secretion system F family protein n=1 Tax=Sphingomonas sp. 7/4-4 TaxID=3018446 RepID=UPI0022F3A778|nr:type II secretion system F family protein [Sphingomonas sp. 7/4-4]WBY07498.1 type II secretion system F family protein [Sphingomonas sp. 7/4-4]
MWEAALNQFPRFVILGGLFAVVVLLVIGVSTVATSRAAIRRRLAETATARGPGAAASLRGPSGPDAWSSLVDAIEKRGISLLDTNNAGLVAKLAAAGYTSPQAPRVFTLIRVGTTLCLPLLLVAATLINGAPPSLFKLYMFGSLLAVLGLYLPNLWVSARASRRQDQITRGFPDALDLMLVCVEAGLGMEAAFDRVGREMATTHPLVAGLLANTVLELRAGRGREDALRRMGERAGVDQIKSFATLLIQSNKLGSSIGQTLRIYATEMRERRKMLAQEKAHRLPVLLSIPLVACMLPVMIGVLMLPAAIRVVRQLMPMMSG